MIWTLVSFLIASILTAHTYQNCLSQLSLHLTQASFGCVQHPFHFKCPEITLDNPMSYLKKDS